jgi:hypothetical protein
MELNEYDKEIMRMAVAGYQMEICGMQLRMEALKVRLNGKCSVEINPGFAETSDAEAAAESPLDTGYNWEGGKAAKVPKKKRRRKLSAAGRKAISVAQIARHKKAKKAA